MVIRKVKGGFKFIIFFWIILQIKYLLVYLTVNKITFFVHWLKSIFFRFIVKPNDLKLFFLFIICFYCWHLGLFNLNNLSLLQIVNENVTLVFLFLITYKMCFKNMSISRVLNTIILYNLLVTSYFYLILKRIKISEI